VESVSLGLDPSQGLQTRLASLIGQEFKLARTLSRSSSKVRRSEFSRAESNACDGFARLARRAGIKRIVMLPSVAVTDT
jgi:hypothetical protein